MKIEVFPDEIKAGNINGKRLNEFLKDVKADLDIKYIANRVEGEVLFKKIMILASIVQKFWNDLEEMKEAQKENEKWVGQNS